MRRTCSIGVDYGTESGRAVLLELQTGKILAQAVKPYSHGVMDEALPDGTRLPPDWALQHPGDYLEVLTETIPAVLADSGVTPQEVVGLSIDFTACTMLPVDAQGEPLCRKPAYEHRPNAWVKLWKHHAAQSQATRLTELAEARGEVFLRRYGGKISSEWMLPKLMQILEEDPDIYEAADVFTEAADWVIWQLTGQLQRNSCTAGYKALWHKREGFPSRDFLRALDPRLEDLADTKLRGAISPQGAKAGELTPRMAARLGLLPGTAVAVANVDAHVSLPAVGITQPGRMLMIMGTSTCHILLGQEERLVPGMCGVVEDGVLPGFFGYEAGQSCVGDHFAWCVKNCVPPAAFDEARARGVDIHTLLTEKAFRLRPGESGLVALDWWNGNRSVLVDADLTGLLLGMSLRTKPEEIYRALMEATAYGTRIILENFEENGIPIRDLCACGGIARKNPHMMQLYADVTGREIFIGASDQAPAMGAAMFGAVAAGSARGGFDTIFQAAEALGRVEPRSYRPDPAAHAVYNRLFDEYRALHDYFGRGGSPVMKRLKAIRQEAERHA